MSDTKPEYKGARFYKCALQVNPFGYAGEYGKKISATSEEEYNEQMLQACWDNGIEVVGLADHGNVNSSELLRRKLEEGGITVFPGFEIASAQKIHMVCLYPPEKDETALNLCLGAAMGDHANKLEEDKTHSSSKSCEEITEIIRKQDGFWYAAHMIEGNGLLRLSGTGDNYVNLWKREDLVIAGQIHGTVQDLPDNYRSIVENRDPNYRRDRLIAVINAKDVYSPELLADQSASCLIKMTQPNFEAFKKAFFDPESRIRLNHESKKRIYSFIESIQWEGAGFFRESDCSLSKNLNAVIGGRGTGKTTLLESIRYVLDLPLMDDKEEKPMQNRRKSNFGGSQVTLHVVSKKQRGECYEISRRYGEAPVVRNKEGEVSNLSPSDLLPNVQFLGQNEILAIEQSNNAMLKLIHGFLPDSIQLDRSINEAQEKLAVNRERMIRVWREYDSLESSVKKEEQLREQLKRFELLGIAEKLKNVERLAGEDGIKAQIKAQLLEIRRWIGDYPSIDLGFLESDKITQMPNSEIILGVIKPLLEETKKSLDKSAKQTEESLTGVINAYKSKLSNWEEQSQSIKDELNKAMGELPDKDGISGADLGKQYSEIAQKLAAIEGQKKDYAKQKDLLKQITLEREQLLEEYRGAAFKKFGSMERGINALNESLDKKMRIVLRQKKDLTKLKEFLCGIPGIAGGRLQWLDDEGDFDVDPVAWAKLILDGDKQKFSSKTKFTSGTVDRLFSITPEQCLQMQEIQLSDAVHIELNIDHGEGERYIATENLSTGQKCTAILSLLLLSRDEPLIIDQPEDHLDNAFIADRIVYDLRRSKENRQFIFSTHNANIPVFGDAELIAVLSHENGNGVIKHQGGIDDEKVCQESSNILEGGKEAFNTRKNKYGF